MPDNNKVVQAQWSIDNSLFGLGSVLLKLTKAVRLDDAQGNAAIAFSALGSSILVSPERINDGLDALDTRGRYYRLERFGIMLGLHTGGIATLIRNEVQQCVPAFLLATSLKTLLDDSAIGAILFEMLSLQGLASNPDLRSSRRELTAVVSALSGFSDTIAPAQVVQTVETTLKQVTTDPRHLRLAFLQPDSKQIAEVFSRVFGFLQDDEKKENMITLRGMTSCIIIASSLMWLQENDVSVAVDGTTIATGNAPRILIDIRTSEQAGHWMIQEWKEAKATSTLVKVEQEESWATQNLPMFVPAATAKTVVQAQYALTAADIELVGYVAAALVEIALEKGKIMSDQTNPGIKPRFIEFKQVSQTKYLAECRKCMECYGWTRTANSDAMIEQYVKDLRNWLDQGCPNLGQPQEGVGHPLFQKPLVALTWVLQLISEWSSSRSGSSVQQISPEVAEASCYMAAESMYSATCTRFVKSRSFRTGQFDNIAENAMHILHSVFSNALITAMRTIEIKPSNTLHYMNTITVSQFRAQTMASLLPGAAMAIGYTGTHESGISGRDLIYATNGYVAVASSIQSITTQCSDCMAVEIIPGYLRWDGEDISLQRLMDSGPSGDEGVATTPASPTLNPYDSSGQYIGLAPRQDPEDCSMKHHFAVDKKILWITTSILHPGTNSRVRVDWMGSMEAIVMAQHIYESALPAFIEQTIAESWERTKLWRTIGWTTGSGKIMHKQGTPVRYISQTYGHEELRFFLAGRRSMQRLFIRHGTTPLVKCIQEALAYETTSGETSRKVNNPLPPWIQPEMEEQMRFPGWLIIT